MNGVIDPLVLDSKAAAILFVGAVELAANPFENFRSNRTRFRLEGNARLVVLQPLAIHEIAVGS